MDVGFSADVPQIVQYLVDAQAHFLYEEKTTRPKVAVRSTRGPIFLKFVRVHYDKTQRKLALSKGGFPGRSFVTHSIKYHSYTGGHAEPTYSAGKKIPRGYPHMKKSLMEINLGMVELYRIDLITSR